MVNLTIKNFDEIMLQEKRVVVDFWATWCSPCRMMAPNFSEVSEELGDEFVFAKCEIDDEPTLAKKYEIYSIPTIVIFENGVEIARNVGFLNKNDLKSFIKMQN